jgi:hypothetical protein
VSSSGDDAGEAKGVGSGAGAAAGALRICPGIVCAERAFSVATWLLPASAASLITTAGVEGSSLGTYGLDGVVTPTATELASGELGAGSGAGGGVAGLATTGATGAGARTGAAATATGATGGCEGPTTMGAMPSSV